MSDFPTAKELDAMSEQELRELWKELVDECSSNEGTVACRAFCLGWRLGRKEIEE